MTALINLNKINKGFLVKKKLNPVINNMSFDINRNEVISIVGPSGCGKTTILKIIANLLVVDSGEILFNGKEILKSKTNHSVGYVPQNHTLLPNRTVLENITLPLEINGKKDFQKALDLVDLMGLSEYKDHYPSQISGGMKQKVSIARALVLNPDLLLLDEPFASVDEISREKFNLELLRLNKILKRSMILVTHNIEEAVFMSDRILVMSGVNGSIISEVNIPLGDARNPETRSSELFFSTTNIIRKLIKTNE
jgi:NitT/TauT family transport system ATP-binding protein